MRVQADLGEGRGSEIGGHLTPVPMSWLTSGLQK